MRAAPPHAQIAAHQTPALRRGVQVLHARWRSVARSASGEVFASTSAMTPHHLITGATGFLGRHLVRGLLARGQRVSALVRGDDDQAALSRLVAVLGDGVDVANLRVVAGDLVGSFGAERLLRGAPLDHVWHLAARLDLGRRRPVRLHEVNVAGTAAVLDLCERGRVGRLHHVSTAYVCGAANGPVLEDEGVGPVMHHNAYESSKYRAEALVRAAARRGLAASIYRPSIVVGDSRDGRAETFGAFYLVVRLCYLAREVGPIILPGSPDVTLDLVPVDRVIAALLALHARDDVSGHTFHLTNPAPPTIRDLVEAGNAALDMRIAEVRDVPADELPWPSSALFEPAAAMLPYLRRRLCFDGANVAERLGPDFLRVEQPPRQWLTQLMQHAVQRDFGLDRAALTRDVRLLRRMLEKAVRPERRGGQAIASSTAS